MAEESLNILLVLEVMLINARLYASIYLVLFLFEFSYFKISFDLEIFELVQVVSNQGLVHQRAELDGFVIVGSGELILIEEFIYKNPYAVTKDAVHFLVSCSVDAFYNNDSGVARILVRCALFLESYLMSPATFLSDLHSEKPLDSMCAGIKHFKSELNNTESRIGLLQFLEARTSPYCTCLSV